MDDNDEQDTYVAQLQEVFDSCDSNGSGYLDRQGITLLCQQLQLDEQAPFFVQHLLKDEPEPSINFKEFKDEFISLLTRSIGQPEPAQDVASPEREISPKYVHGNKKYGRRSQPESQGTESGDERISDVSDSEVFDNETTTTQEESGIDGAYAELDIMEHDGYAEQQEQHQPNSKVFNKRKRKATTDLIVRPSPLQKYEESEPDYLRDVWKKLAVGTDGYLDLTELERVCEHIGMEKMTQEVVSQLFAKLDTDHDGKISFEEFLNVFQSSEVGSTPVARADVTAGNNSIAKVNEECCETSISNTSESGMFSSLDLGNKGIASVEAVVDLWESLGFNNGYQMLKELGMGASSNIRLQDLSNILEEALISCDDPQLRQMAFATMNWELRHLRNNLDQLRTERDKLKTDVTEANIRATLLAQEVDDQNAKLEKSSANKVIMIERKCKEQIQSLIEKHDAEREQSNAQVVKLRQTLDDEEKHWREDDNHLKEEIEQEQKENSRLESEIKELSEKLSEMEKLNQRHQKDLESLNILRQKLDELESGELIHENKYKTLLVEMETLKLENQTLTDCNDELALKVESLQQQLAARPPARHAPSHKRNGSWLGEYVQNTSAKRRGNGLNSPNDDLVDHSQKMAKVQSKSPEVFEEYGTDMDDYDPYEDDTPYGDIIPLPSQPLQTPVSSVFEMKQVFQFLKNKMYSEFMNECEDDMMLSVKNLENQNDSLQLQLKELKVRYEQELAQSREEFQRTFELETGKWRKKWLDLQSEVELQLARAPKADKSTEVERSWNVELGAAEDGDDDDTVVALKEQLGAALDQLQQTLQREKKIVGFYESVREEYKNLKDRARSSAAGLHSGLEGGDTFQQQKEAIEICRDEQNQSNELAALLNELSRFRESYETTKVLLDESRKSRSLEKEEFAGKERALSGEVRTLREVGSDLKSRCCSLERELSNLRNGISKPARSESTAEEPESLQERHLEVVQELEMFWKGRVESERDHHEMESIQLRNRIVRLETRLNEIAESAEEIGGVSDNSHGGGGVVIPENVPRKEDATPVCNGSDGSEYSTAAQTMDSDLVVANQHLAEELQRSEEKLKSFEKQSRMQIKHANKTLKLVKEQHQEEIVRLKMALNNTQSVMKRQMEDYDGRLEKADELVQKLYLENAQLVKALQVTEERQKKSEQLNAHLHDRCNALTQLVSDIYKIT